MRRLLRHLSVAALVGLCSGTLALGPAAAQEEPPPLDPTYGDGGVATLWGPPDDGAEPERVIAWGIAVDPSGRAIVPSGHGGVHRLDDDGRPDAEFGTDGFAAGPAELRPFGADAAAGGIAISGSTWDRAPAVLRLLEDGTPDPRLDGDGLAELTPPADGVDGWAPDAAIGPDGALTVLALWDRDSTALSVHRFTEDGDVDVSFGEHGAVWFDVSRVDAEVSWDLDVDPSGIVVAVSHDVAELDFWSELHRLRLDGTPDPGFGTAGTVRLEGFGVQGLAIDERDGSLLVGGAAKGQASAAVLKRRPDGTPDRRFAGGAAAPVPGSRGLVWGIAALPGGRVAVQADGHQEVTAVLRPDGSPETAFGDGGAVPSEAWPMTAGGIGVDPAGRLLVGRLDRGEVDERTTVRRYDLAALPELAPAVTSVEVLDGALSVEWTPAEVELGGPVRMYHVVAFDQQGAVASQQVVAGDVRQTSLPGVATASSLLSDLGSGLAPAYTVVVQPYDELGPVLASDPRHVDAVFDPPAAPQPSTAVAALTATAGRGDATVGWSPPAHDGGSPITSYSVVATRADDGTFVSWRNVPADLRSASIEGLANDVAYDLHVVPATAEGFGAVAPAVEVTPTAGGAAPQPPEVAWMSAVALSATHAVVTWGPQVERGEPATRFHVIVIDDDGDFVSWKTASPSQRQLVVRAPGGSDVYVLAQSATGYGPWQTSTLPA